MTDETLVAKVKEVGKHYLELQAECRKRGMEVRMHQHYRHGGDDEYEIQVLRQV